MAESPPQRSVKIADDERGGWSSDRPRRGNAPPRPADLSVRCRVLSPSDSLRYSPGSLLVVVSGSADELDEFVQRVVEARGAVLGLRKVRGMLEGRVPEDEIEERAVELLDAAALKRLEAGETVVLAANGLDAEERERFVRTAARLKRPRHLILLETARDRVPEEDRAALNDLRTRLDSGAVGSEGFQTALRLGGSSAGELKRIVFQPPPRDD
ncbi:MAG TPA: hypothetical protein VF545_04065 [Thermoleophilaceae bacterium]|jgi:hypothetical protein